MASRTCDRSTRRSQLLDHADMRGGTIGASDSIEKDGDHPRPYLVERRQSKRPLGFTT